jgi:N-formylglutamate deformylase
MQPILHIPHAAVTIPAGYHATYLGGQARIDIEHLQLADLHTDRLFASPGIDAQPLVFPYSRIFVDVERFRDASQEIMSARGMGALYTHGYKLEPLRTLPDAAGQEGILQRYYDPHHAKLTALVDAQLAAQGQALIIDCHSFASQRLPYENNSPDERPEICIGTDAYHTPEWMTNTLLKSFAKRGYEITVNHPFAGSIVPIKHYHKSPAVMSVMLEIRRDLFTDEATGQPNRVFNRVQADIEAAISSLLQLI